MKCIEINLTSVNETKIKIDLEDLSLFEAYSWTLRQGYVVSSVPPYPTLSRLVMGYMGDMEVDHINRDKLDNRKENLRICTPQQNRLNKEKYITVKSVRWSVYKGVSWKRGNRKWCARLTFKGKTFNIGYFKDEIEAAKAYDTKAKELFEDFAVLNFPDL